MRDHPNTGFTLFQNKNVKELVIFGVNNNLFLKLSILAVFLSSNLRDSIMKRIVGIYKIF